MFLFWQGFSRVYCCNGWYSTNILSSTGSINWKWCTVSFWAGNSSNHLVKLAKLVHVFWKTHSPCCCNWALSQASKKSDWALKDEINRNFYTGDSSKSVCNKKTSNFLLHLLYFWKLPLSSQLRSIIKTGWRSFSNTTWHQAWFLCI